MREVKINKISKEAFERYGSFASVLNPTGDYIGSKPVTFYRDMVQQSLGSECNVSYSACVIEERPWIIDCTESHDTCHETIICLDGDYLIHVAPATQKSVVPFDEIEVFLVPKGTIVSVKAGVWHQAGFPYNCSKVHILCALPERAYAKDCDFVVIPEEKQIKVINEIV